MDRLHFLSVLSVLFACSMVTGQYRWYTVPEQRDTTRPPYSDFKYPLGNRYWRHHHCRESNLQYDCIFSHVSIDSGSHGIRFGHLDITANNQKNITFKNSIIRKLPETLLDSFLQAELLNLTGLQIEEIEPFALTNGNIRELYLGLNVIRELPKFVFRNMRYLRVLVLDRNNLSSLPEGMLYATPNIVKLSIANNKLKRIDDSTFKKCKALQYLTVSNNELTHIDLSLIPSLFRGNVSYNKLQTLSVPVAVIMLDASHNLINTVMGPINPELAILRLQDNNLTDTAFLWHYSGLVDLHLSYNELKMITFDHFSEMIHLERLYLANNRLEVLNLDPAPIPKLQILDVRHNYLLDVERNQNQFDSLTELYLDHNSIVTLKLSPNNTIQNLTLSNNDWDCSSLDVLFGSVHESIILDSDQHCKPDYLLKQNLCCKFSDKPYLDRLMQYIREISITEKFQRADGRCSASDTLTSIRSLTDYVNQHARSGLLQSNPQLQAEINQLQDVVCRLIYEQTQLEHFLEIIQIDIDNYLRRYRVTKEGLVHPSENLRSIFDYLNSRRALKEQETKQRQSEANRKKQERETTEQENRTLHIQLDAKRIRQEELKNVTRVPRSKGADFLWVPTDKCERYVIGKPYDPMMSLPQELQTAKFVVHDVP
ncbi:uncharacterized protein LOC125772422 [Anopheles funestus]|uniref:uncharacterized protein LOC125772422 n=1 Tax=Anopheles funestus TaxID=62324 RepID=UPI0020C6AE96|nr:uncharacterized protein LOC125772422 [Anopheles funestus]